MSTKFKLNPLKKPVIDVTGEKIVNGFSCIIYDTFFKHYNFTTNIKLRCNNCDFSKNQLMLHAWAIDYDGKIINKQTHVTSNEWMKLSNQNTNNELIWPNIQESELEEFGYNMLFIIEPLENNISTDFSLTLESDGKITHDKSGFAISISNENNTPVEIKLFSEVLPHHTNVRTINSLYFFRDLKKWAKENTFIGNTITTNSNEVLELEIVNKKKIEKIYLNGRFEGPKISINGDDSFIKINCPANSNFYIKLNNLPD